MPYAFTPTGVENMMEDLYNLLQPALDLEADAAKADFRGWIEDKFLLDPTQIAFLGDIDEDWLDFNGAATCIALKNRLPITLIEPAAYRRGVFSSKIIRTEISLSVPTDGMNSGSTGNLAFNTEII